MQPSAAAAAGLLLSVLGPLGCRTEKERAPPTEAGLAGPDAGATEAGRPLPRRPLPLGFLKGQLHVHTSHSADSRTPPAAVHRWYEERGYDFVVFTDHNVVTDTNDTAMLSIPGVELTLNLTACEPPPPRGRSCLLHMNVLFASPDAGPLTFGQLQSVSRRDLYVDELKQAQRLGGIAVLNHPNMEYAANEALVHELSRQGLTLLEVGNQSWDSENAGDAEHPSSEAIWDGVLTRGARVFATVTDDAHHYGDAAALAAQGVRPYTGDLGFVVVRAEKSAPGLRAAIARGDFYGSTGVVFEKYEPGAEAISLATRDGAAVLFEVIGRGGVVTRRERGSSLEARLGPDDGPYLRVRATASDGSFAWTQPVFRAARPAR